jgi:hypothetical protein
VTRSDCATQFPVRGLRDLHVNSRKQGGGTKMAAGNDATVSRRDELRYSGRRVAVSDLRRRNPTAATRRVGLNTGPMPECATVGTGPARNRLLYLRTPDQILFRTWYCAVSDGPRWCPTIVSLTGSKPATLFTGRRTASARRLPRYVNFKMTRNWKLNSLFSRRSDTVRVSIRSSCFGKVPNLVRSCVR